MTSNVERGEIYFADLSPVVGSEQGGIRPVLIVQNDVGNKHSPTVIAAAITSKHDKAKLPTHIEIGGKGAGFQGIRSCCSNRYAHLTSAVCVSEWASSTVIR